MDVQPEMAPAMALALRANFGSLEGWRDDLRKAAGDGAGVHLVFLPEEGRLVHRRGAGEGVAVLGLAATDDAALAAIRWAEVYERYQHAVEQASGGCAAAPDDVAGALLLDVRRAGVFEQATTQIPGARWCDPGDVSRWAGTLPIDREVVVYCVYGHEVGRSTALRLRAAGVRARYLRGGIDGWQAAGRPLETKG